MNSHRSNRVQKLRSVVRHRIGGAISLSRSALHMRQLLCEQLERRYALYGMDWLDEAVQTSDYSGTMSVEVATTSGRQAQILFLYRDGRSSEMPQGNLSERSVYIRRLVSDDPSAGDRGSDASVLNSSSSGDSLERICCRLRSLGALRGEGEGPGFMLIRPGIQPDIGQAIRPSELIVDKPESKVEIALPVGSSPQVSVVTREPAVGERNDTAVARPSQENTIKPTIPESTGSSALSGSSNVPRTTDVSVSQVRTTLLDFLGGRGLGTQPIASAGGTASDSVSFSTATPASFGSREAIPLLNSKFIDAAVVTFERTPTSNVSSAADSAMSLTFLQERSNDRPTNDGLATAINEWKRTASSGSASRADKETEGLLLQLRSVIEELAGENQTDKPGIVSEGRQHNSFSTKPTGHDFARSVRRQIATEDGMLELALATDRLATSTLVNAGGVQERDATQHRGQLIASLEFHREFELAGQLVQSTQSVADPTNFYESGQVDSAESLSQWRAPETTAPLSSADQTSSAESFWQRSLLPISFMAIGGFLLRRKRRVQNTFTAD